MRFNFHQVRRVTIAFATLVIFNGFASEEAFANRVIATPGKAAVVVSQPNTNQRLCYYDDKSYSLGAVLEVSGVLIECKAEKEFELNGTLQWVQLKKKDK
ncbi:DUF1496 domain-containing protein [Vibrio sp. 99-70-13A1]|uniref:DUF1496 domain-containing protein n=1 Tax=Vibrio sp. 99-70-13A1 TaxID=2607601 RepID=UPI0014933C65|nr:DUF1496 domain-containing protein [Vibrio sp. 99-70-13A1]NOH95765.1 DUF1496 domain-containing protein [Vibrio sp. 99-70-13A1]